MKTYIPTDIIAKKRDKKQLTAEEIRFLVDSYTDGLLPDYQMASFLMAVYLNGMNDEETAAMTEAMVNSGDILDFSEIEGIKADKHSTGGVGDKTTLVLVPILAAAGVKTVKMSGRGLGFTGGTIDKLQSIKGYRTALSEEEIHRELRTLNAVMIGATGDIAPADKKIYALRDVTATVESIPLIASSIMSKKIACGADVIVIDIKVGSGAFMKTMAEAEELSRRLIKIGESFGRRVDTVFGSMDDVLGYAVGNLLEVREALETLRGRGPRDLTDLCLEIAQKIIDAADIKADAAEILASGKALEYFGKIVTAQGGDLSSIDDPNRNAPFVREVKAPKSGTIAAVNAAEVGMTAGMLGAGRLRKEDEIDPLAGITAAKKLGDEVKAGEVIAVLYTSNESVLDDAEKRLLAAYDLK